MNNFHLYDECLTILLPSSGDAYYWISKTWQLQYFDGKTSRFLELEITEQLEDLFITNKNLRNDSQFQDIKKLFRDNLQEKKITLQNKTCFQFIVPNKWKEEWDFLNVAFIPMLEQAGVTFLRDPLEQVSYITELEAILAYQLPTLNSTEELPDLFKPENRCILYNFKSTCEDNVVLESVYFKLKEDYNLKLLGQQYFTPKIKGVDNYALDGWNWTSFIPLVQKEVEKKYKLPVNNTEIFEDTLAKIEGILRERRDLYLLVDDDVPDNSTDSDIYFRSRSFLKIVFNKILESFRYIISDVLNYIEIQNSTVPYHKKQIIFHMSIINQKHSWNKKIYSSLYPIFYYLLCNEICHYFVEPDLSMWHVFVPNLYEDILKGAGLKLERRSILSNMSLPPVLMKEQTAVFMDFNNRWKVLRESLKLGKIPEHILYFDICSDATTILHEHTNTSSIHVKEQFPVDINDTTLPSVALFFNAEFSSKDIKYFIEYLEKLVRQSKNHLIRNEKIDMKTVGYVVSIEKRLMIRLGIKSRDEILQLVEENDLVDFTDNRRRMIIVDRGDKLVSDLLEESQTPPESYYVHTHIENDSMYLKLKQVVDITEYGGGKHSTSDVLIKDNFVTTQNTYEQVCETLWRTISSLDENYREDFWNNKCDDLPNYENDYEAFNKQVTAIIKENVDNVALHPHGNNSDSLEKEYIVYLSDERNFLCITLQHIMEIAVIPVLKRLISDIVSSVIDTNLFGYYHITKMVLTGSFLNQKVQSNIFNHTVISEIEKEFKEQMRGRVYQFQVIIGLVTSSPYQSTIISSNDGTYKMSSFYDRFLRGELRVVANMTYWRSSFNILIYQDKELCNQRVPIDLGHSNPINISRQRFLPSEFDWRLSGDSCYPNLPITDSIYVFSDIQPLHYISCLKLTLEGYFKPTTSNAGIPEEVSIVYLFRERQTLRYS